MFSGLRFFNEPEISDLRPQLKVPPGGLVLRFFTSWKKSIDFSLIWTREPLISRRARYPETTEADMFGRIYYLVYTALRIWSLYSFVEVGHEIMKSNAGCRMPWETVVKWEVVNWAEILDRCRKCGAHNDSKKMTEDSLVTIRGELLTRELACSNSTSTHSGGHYILFDNNVTYITYLLFDPTALEELWPPCDEGFFI